MQTRRSKPTVSPLIMPLLYCHINGLQRASSVEKPWPGGEKKRAFGQKTQTHHFHRVYEPTFAHSTSCIPSGYVPYSPPLRDNDCDGMTHGLETTAHLYHQFRQLG